MGDTEDNTHGRDRPEQVMEEKEKKITRERQNRKAHGKETEENRARISTRERQKITAHGRDISEHHMEETGENS
jgi:hypothetical protein